MKECYGGVLFNEDGQVLLRMPTGHFSGTVWTFAKGERQSPETPEETALREVKEETGYEARVLVELPGAYRGQTSDTRYFLMSPNGAPGEFDRKETAEVTWVTPAEAVGHILQTHSRGTQERDLMVLVAAVTEFTRLRSRQAASA